MLIFRYLLRETLKSQIAVFLVLMAIFVIQKFVRVLAAATDGDIPAGLVLGFLALNMPVLASLILPLSLFLGWRYVRSRHGNGFSAFISASSTIGIALGVAILIVVLSAMNGFERELSQKLLSIVPQVELVGVNEPIPNWPQSIKKIQQHKRSSVKKELQFIKQ